MLDCVDFCNSVLCYVANIFFFIVVRAKFCQNERFCKSTFLRSKFKNGFLLCTLFFSECFFSWQKRKKRRPKTDFLMINSRPVWREHLTGLPPKRFRESLLNTSSVIIVVVYFMNY